MSTIQNQQTTLKNLRLQMGVHQRDVAIKAGLPIRTLQNYEAGISKPNVVTAQRLADTLGTTIEELFPPMAANTQ